MIISKEETKECMIHFISFLFFFFFFCVCVCVCVIYLFIYYLALSILRSRVENEEVCLNETIKKIRRILDLMDTQFHAAAEVEVIVKRITEKTAEVLKKVSANNH